MITWGKAHTHTQIVTNTNLRTLKTRWRKLGYGVLYIPNFVSWNRINEFWVCLHCTTKSLYWTQKQEQKRTHGQTLSIDNTNILGTIHSNDKLETDETFSLENKSSENYHIVSDHVNEDPASRCSSGSRMNTSYANFDDF